MEVVGKYLDYFVRVREVIPIETLVNRVTEQIEKDGLGDQEKRRQHCCCGSSPSSARAENVIPSMWKN